MKHLLLLLVLASQETCCGLAADTLFVSTSTFSPGRAGTFEVKPPLTVPANAAATSAATEHADEVSDAETAVCEHAVEHVPLANAPVKTSDWLRGNVVGGYSAIIDVRSPSEYQDDHIPGSINLPVLSDEQRHEVGKLHRADHFAGRRLGASLISNNIATIIQNYFMDKPKDWRPLIYCWRGGQRSNSLAYVLAMIGYRVCVLDRGYLTYRNHIISQISSFSDCIKAKVITGPTGCGKTKLLHFLSSCGEQILDLEGLANHKGSILGGIDLPQPPQKLFETRIAQVMRTFDFNRTVWIEDEAATIGKLHIPRKLWEAMLSSPRYFVRLPFNERVRHTLCEYDVWTRRPDELKKSLSKLIEFHGRARYDRWCSLIDSQNFELLVAELLEKHYDPANLRSIQDRITKKHVLNETVHLTSLNIEDLDREARVLLSQN